MDGSDMHCRESNSIYYDRKVKVALIRATKLVLSRVTLKCTVEVWTLVKLEFCVYVIFYKSKC